MTKGFTRRALGGASGFLSATTSPSAGMESSCPGVECLLSSSISQCLLDQTPHASFCDEDCSPCPRLAVYPLCVPLSIPFSRYRCLPGPPATTERIPPAWEAWCVLPPTAGKA